MLWRVTSERLIDFETIHLGDEPFQLIDSGE